MLGNPATEFLSDKICMHCNHRLELNIGPTASGSNLGVEAYLKCATCGEGMCSLLCAIKHLKYHNHGNVVIVCSEEFDNRKL